MYVLWLWRECVHIYITALALSLSSPLPSTLPTSPHTPSTPHTPHALFSSHQAHPTLYSLPPLFPLIFLLPSLPPLTSSPLPPLFLPFPSVPPSIPPSTTLELPVVFKLLPSSMSWWVYMVQTTGLIWHYFVCGFILSLVKKSSTYCGSLWYVCADMGITVYLCNNPLGAEGNPGTTRSWPARVSYLTWSPRSWHQCCWSWWQSCACNCSVHGLYIYDSAHTHPTMSYIPLVFVPIRNRMCILISYCAWLSVSIYCCRSNYYTDICDLPWLICYVKQ